MNPFSPTKRVEIGTKLVMMNRKQGLLFKDAIHLTEVACRCLFNS
jgi:hypothetical protein